LESDGETNGIFCLKKSFGLSVNNTNKQIRNKQANIESWWGKCIAPMYLNAGYLRIQMTFFFFYRYSTGKKNI
jgi:hypothetical protein